MNKNSFGIPINKGKILATGKNGVVVSYNLRALNINRLYRAQLYLSDRQSLTEVVSPHIRVTDIFNYTRSSAQSDLQFAQQEYKAIVFINTPKFTFSDDVRIIFWFKRYPTRVEKDEDKIDVPDEAIPLMIALVKKEYLSHVKKPIPKDIEQTIAEETIKLSNRKDEIISKNYWFTDTLSIPNSKLNVLDKEDDEIEAAKQKTEKIKVAPVKYLPKHYKEVDKLSKHLKKTAAIESVANKYGFSIEGFKQQYYTQWYNKKK